MVYRGKPSAGCENCRKAKKKCGLEKPACARCVKLKKICSGYRDTTGLQIEDESEAVKRKADKQKPRSAENATMVIHVNSARSPQSNPSTGDDAVEFTQFRGDEVRYNNHAIDDSDASDSDLVEESLVVPPLIRSKADDVATIFFYKQFTSIEGHWGILRDMAEESRMDPTLACAIRACGMASLDNVQCIVKGRDMARIYYADALGLLNESLRDPRRCKSDECLIAVSLLGIYENLTCEDRQSIRSWKAHIKGATQLLRLRGKQQFRHPLGRMLFREIRAQIMISCLWDNVEPPTFLLDWNEDLHAASKDVPVNFEPVDAMAVLAFDYASLQHRMAYKKIAVAEAIEAATKLEIRIIQWSNNAMERSAWRYYDIEVDDSPHVWNGIVHAYSGAHAGYTVGGMWNTYRTVRIMLTRMCENLCKQIPLSFEGKAAQLSHLRSVRRQMADEICCAIPSQLGHAAPAWNSPCPLLSAYASVWPLFFAGTCVLERVGGHTWTEITTGKGNKSFPSTSAAAAQAAWIIGRLHYISKVIGLRWADGMIAVLRGEFECNGDLLPGYVEFNRCKDGLLRILMYDRTSAPAWTEKIRESGRGVRILLEAESPLSDALNVSREQNGPIWRGRALDDSGI